MFLVFKRYFYIRFVEWITSLHHLPFKGKFIFFIFELITNFWCDRKFLNDSTVLFTYFNFFFFLFSMLYLFFIILFKLRIFSFFVRWVTNGGVLQWILFTSDFLEGFKRISSVKNFRIEIFVLQIICRTWPKYIFDMLANFFSVGKQNIRGDFTRLENRVIVFNQEIR